MPEDVAKIDGEPIINVRGDLVALGPLRRELLPLYQRWINDPEVMRGVAEHRPMTAEQEEAWYDEQKGREDIINFTVYELPSCRPIGNTAIGQIDYLHGTASFGILLGEPDARGKGYGTEATRLILRYAFDFAGLHNVELGVYEFNRAGIRAYEKAGFREIGRRREAYLHGGRRWDEIRMDCLATEFRARYAPNAS